MKRGWYHTASMDGFSGIEHSSQIEKFSPLEQEYYQWGPFKTFEIAKEDAIEYYRCDIDIARKNIRDIRAYKPLSRREKKK